MPDIVAVSPDGVVLFVECKRDNAEHRMSLDQRVWRQQIMLGDAEYLLIDDSNVEESVALIKAYGIKKVRVK